MNNVLMLTKVLLKTNFLSGMGEAKKGKKKNKYLGWIGIGILLLFVVCSLGIPIVFAFDSILEVVPMQNLFLALHK